ncbi:MAG: LysM peptidoglycan-binding domain-containing protein [Caldilineaceae bacterium]|nr:LysM peptidoglycan-binding domain-containing protein [Caldilineaceae bacterium]
MTPASEVYAQDVTYHTVRPGESLSRIASIYGVSVAAIQRANAIANPNVVRPGQTLAIPLPSRSVAPTAVPAQPAPTRAAASAPAAQPVQRATPVVVAVPTDAPAPVKPTSQPTRPAPTATQDSGQPIPTATPYAPRVRYYTVRPGDTLYGIAARFGVSVSAIKARNRLAGNVIYPGQSLAIP